MSLGRRRWAWLILVVLMLPLQALHGQQLKADVDGCDGAPQSFWVKRDGGECSGRAWR